MLRIYDPQKHRSCTHRNFMTLLLISNVYKIFCFCESLIRSSQSCQITTIACRQYKFQRVKFFFDTHYRIDKIFFCVSPSTWPTCKSRITVNLNSFQSIPNGAWKYATSAGYFYLTRCHKSPKRTLGKLCHSERDWGAGEENNMAGER